MTDRIYLAGPDVFLPDAEKVGDRKKALCERYGFTGVFPTDTDLYPQAFDTSEQFALAIYQVSNAVLPETGIMAVTIAGMAVGNIKTRALGDLKEFKEPLPA